jgi:hypothetical protein
MTPRVRHWLTGQTRVRLVSWLVWEWLRGAGTIPGHGMLTLHDCTRHQVSRDDLYAQAGTDLTVSQKRLA